MEENQQIEPQKASKLRTFWETAKYAVLALIIVVPFRIFIAQPYIVSGSSMDPTFKDVDYLIVDQLSKRFELPERQSVVIIKYPGDTSKYFIKRLIGFPGETIEIKNGIVKIYNTEKKESLILDEPYVYFKKDENFSITLSDDQFFVLGDNRAGSYDSRYWGSLPEKDIIGVPIIRLFPFNKIDFKPGELKTKQ